MKDKISIQEYIENEKKKLEESKKDSSNWKFNENYKECIIHS